MKKLNILLAAVVLTLLASCAKPSEKAAGTYSGTATINGGASQVASAVVAANGDDKVDIQITVNSTLYTANAVSASLSNDVVTLTYTSSTTTTNELTSLTGNVTGNTMTVSGNIVLSYPIVIPGTFTGTK